MSVLSVSFLSQSLRNYVRGLVHQDCDVDDILHDTYIKMTEATQVIEHPHRYAKRVAKNIVLDKHKHHFNQHEEMIDEPKCEKSDLDMVMEQTQRIEFYQHILANMPTIRRDVFSRYRIGGESKQAIAQDLGISNDSVDKHITRALSSLKTEMEKRLEKAECA